MKIFGELDKQGRGGSSKANVPEAGPTLARLKSCGRG